MHSVADVCSYTDSKGEFITGTLKITQNELLP